MKLKEEVKKGLIIALLFVGIVAFVIFEGNYTNKAIDQCVAGGQSYEVCESGLR